MTDTTPHPDVVEPEPHPAVVESTATLRIARENLRLERQVFLLTGIVYGLFIALYLTLFLNATRGD
jgi:hypothetical protein